MKKSKQKWKCLNEDMGYKNINHAQSITIKIKKYIVILIIFHLWQNISLSR